MLQALTLAFAQLSDPPSRRIVWIGVVGAAALDAGLIAVVGWLLSQGSLTGYAGLDLGLRWLGGLAAFAVALPFLPAVVVMLSGLLVDDIVDRVEARHYPALAPAPRLSWLAGLADALRLALVVVVVNALALPFYVFLPGLSLPICYGVNGFILGREYFGLVANRRLGVGAARRLRRARPAPIFVGGVVIAVLTSIPVVNLFVPVIATAFMVHVFHQMKE